MKNSIFVTTLSDFLEIQRASFCWFLMYGLSNELNFFSSVFSVKKDFEMQFFVQEFQLKKKISETFLYCKQNSLTYRIMIYVPVQITRKKIKQVIRNQSVFIAQLPLMSRNATFIINGYERVIVHQIIRCPGLYYKNEIIKEDFISTFTLVSQRGSWLNFEFDKYGCWIRVDKNSRTPIFDFLYGIGFNDAEIKNSLKSEFVLYKYKSRQKFLKFKYPDNFLSQDELYGLCSRLFNPKFYELGKVGRLSLNRRLGLNCSLEILTITPQDIFSILDYFFIVKSFIEDDIDDLKNRQIRSVGEILENQFRIGLNRLERNILQKVSNSGYERIALIPSYLITPTSLGASLKEFFGSSQLSQYMDQINPLAELTHKRRVSALGPGGLNAERVSVSARDIHPSQYGRICPIETPEGQNVGLVTTLACYAKINFFGFLETPYYKVKHGKICDNEPIRYLTAIEEENLKIAAADVKRNKDGFLVDEFVIARFKQQFLLIKANEINFISVSPIQII